VPAIELTTFQVLVGTVRALDCGALTIDRLFKIVKGQNLKPITDAWEETLAEHKKE
jgi:hypothetical protein